MNEAEAFCRKQNILYSRTPIQRSLEQIISYELSKIPEYKAQFHTLDWLKQIEEIIVTIDGYQLTYQYGWKCRDDHFVKEPIEPSVSKASLEFFKKINSIVISQSKFIRGDQVFKKCHNGLVICYDQKAFIPRPIYWELISVKAMY